MATTPLWVPLVVALVAVLGTLAGVIFTQTWNSRLDERRWARENQRLRAAQAREDLNRTYEHRRTAYVDFLQEYERVQRIHDSSYWANTSGIDKSAFEGLSDHWTAVSIYGTPQADIKAANCIAFLLAWAHEPKSSARMGAAADARKAYLSQIRIDLGVPDRQPASSFMPHAPL